MDTAQLLREMGIDVWRARRRTDATSPSHESPAPDAPPAAPAAGHMPPAPVPAAQAPASSVKPAAADQHVPPFSVLSACNGAALLLAQVSDLRQTQRFVLDVLNAIGGGSVRSLLFEWPQPGLEPGAGSAARALKAFARRQLDEAGATLVVVSSDVLDRLEEPLVPEDSIVVGPFDELMTDGAQKRQLWETLKRRLPA